MVQSVF